jgi:hypothetical protein
MTTIENFCAFLAERSLRRGVVFPILGKVCMNDLLSILTFHSHNSRVTIERPELRRAGVGRPLCGDGGVSSKYQSLAGRRLFLVRKNKKVPFHKFGKFWSSFCAPFFRERPIQPVWYIFSMAATLVKSTYCSIPSPAVEEWVSTYFTTEQRNAPSYNRGLYQHHKDRTQELEPFGY